MTHKIALTAVALAALTFMSAAVHAEDAPQPPPQAGEPAGGPAGGPRADGFEKRGREMFDKTDTNHDGFISKEEMLASHRARIEEMFDKTDTNHDGKLSPEELKAGREAMRDKFREKYKEGKAREQAAVPGSDKAPEKKPAE